MSLYEVNATATPTDISAMLGVGVGSSATARIRNAGQFAVYRMVAATPPTNLDGAVWEIAPGEISTFNVHAGAMDGNTYIASSAGTVRVILEDSVPR